MGYSLIPTVASASGYRCPDHERPAQQVEQGELKDSRESALHFSLANASPFVAWILHLAFIGTRASVKRMLWIIGSGVVLTVMFCAWFIHAVNKGSDV